jgi:hypothetical protein
MTQKRNAQGAIRHAVAWVVAWVAVLMAAAPLSAELPAYGMMTVGRRQTAVLHAVLTHQPSADHPGCRLTASFVDAKGDTLKNAAGLPIQASWVLRDNVAASLSLRAADVLGDLEARKLVRAAVLEDTASGASDCCALTLTMEVSNSLGGPSLVAYPRSPNPPNPLCTVQTER